MRLLIKPEKHRLVSQARYIDWFFTTPLLLLDILLIAGTPFGTTLWYAFATALQPPPSLLSRA